MNRFKTWLKPGIILISLALLSLLAPDRALDPWELIHLKKISLLILSLGVIQLLAEILITSLGPRAGVMIAGFLSGLISSTALTATIARKSEDQPSLSLTVATLTYLWGNMAMLCQALLFILIGTRSLPLPLLLIFVGPTLTTAFMIATRAQAAKEKFETVKKSFSFQVGPILKLATFILVILALSKVLQQSMGQSGLFMLTFIASLFEIHGTIIANVQIFEARGIELEALAALVAISIASSYLSKLFLVATLGRNEFKKIILKVTLWMLASLGLSWGLFIFLA